MVNNMNITAKNLNQLRKELKPLEGKAMFTLTRTNSMNDGVFNRVLHQVKQNELVFFDGQQLTYLPVSAKEIEFLPDGFKIKNCTYQLNRIMNAA